MSTLADEKKWYWWAAHSPARMVFRREETEFPEVWSLWQLILPTLSLYPLPFSLKSVKNYWGYLDLKSFTGNPRNSQPAAWPTGRLNTEHVSPPLWDTQQTPSPADVTLPQAVCSSRKETPTSFNCFPSSFRFNLTQSPLLLFLNKNLPKA